MTTTAELLVDAYGRIEGTVHVVLDRIDPDVLTYRPDPSANTVAWLVWHLTRVQDDHIAGVAGHEQVWTEQGWARRFDLPFDDTAIGYGQDAEEVGRVRSSVELLGGYFDAVHARTVAYLGTVTDADLDRVVDADWDPPVTLAVRLVSVLNDDLQHAGQAAYLRGVAERVQEGP